MSASLPARPSLEWLRKTAKDRLATLRATNPAAKLAEAQLFVAREHGFPSWRKLKAHVERQLAARPAADEEMVGTLLRHVGTGRLDEARAMLAADLTLVNAIGPHPFWGGRPQPLHVAIETKRRDMFDLLLAHGADVSGTNDAYDDWSPLMLAIQRNLPEMRDELLRRGARVGLVEALMLEDDERVEELLRDENPSLIRPNGGSVLAFARTSLAIDRLLARGVSVDMKDRWGATPIDAVSRLGSRGRTLVQDLVAQGVAAKPTDYARMGDLETLERLIDRDPAIARRDDVMLAAVDFGHHGLVEWLIARGGNVNARSDASSRHTALHAASWNGDLRMVRLLVEAGADRSIRDDQYDASPLGWAGTAIEVSNNPRCADVVAYLEAGDGASTNGRPESGD